MAGVRADLLRDEKPLLDYFTDREVLCRELERAALGPVPGRKIWNIYGDVGQGKTAVLRLLRLKCWLDWKLPVAYVAGRRQLTEVECLKALADSLAEGGLTLKVFQSRFKQWDTQLARQGETGKPLEDLVEHAAKASEMVGDAAGSLHPAAKVGGAVGSIFIQLWLDIARLRLAPLLRDPAKMLTAHFLADARQAAAKRRLVILLDQYEDLAGLDLWLCDLLRQLTAFDLFIVIASQSPLGSLDWDRTWPHWRSQVRTERLEPLGEEHREQLVIRLHEAILGTKPEPGEVRAILATGGSSPLAWQLELVMRKLGYKRGQTRPGDLGQIVGHLLKSTPPGLRPLVEAVSVVRRLDSEMLRALTGSDELEKRLETDEPLRLLLTRNKDEWIMLASLREVLDDYLRDSEPARYRSLHQRASSHYGERIQRLATAPTLTREQREKRSQWEIEQLYHDFHVSPDDGLMRFRRLFERSLLRAEYRDFCRALLNEVRGYGLGDVHKSWIRMYEALFSVQEPSGLDQSLQMLEELRKNAAVDKPLKIGLLESLAVVLLLRNANEDARSLFEECLYLCESFPEDLPGQARALVWLGSLSKKTGTSEKYFTRAAAICDRLGDDFAPTAALLHKEMGDAYRLQGRFREAERSIQASIEAYRNLNMELDLGHALRTRAMLLVYTGKLGEAERLFRESIDLFDRYSSGHSRVYERVWPLIGLGDVALGRRAWKDSLRYYQSALDLCADTAFESAVVEGCLADLYCAQGDWARSLEHSERSLGLREKHADMYGIGWVLCTQGKALMGSARYTDALERIGRGLEVMQDYGSDFVLCKLKLALAETFLRQGDVKSFRSQSQETYQACISHGYADLAARLRLLDGLAMLAEASPSGDGTPAGAMADCFCEALTWALRHNVFMLDALLGELLDRLVDAGDHASSYRKALVDELGSRWIKAVIDGEGVEGVERAERELNRAGPLQKVTVAEQLRRCAGRLSGITASGSGVRHG